MQMPQDIHSRNESDFEGLSYEFENQSNKMETGFIGNMISLNISNSTGNLYILYKEC